MSLNKNISQLSSEATKLDANDILHVSQGGVDKKLRGSTLLQSVTDSTPFKWIPKVESSTSRLITLGDKDSLIEFTNSAAKTVTFPNSSTAPFALGDKFEIKNIGVGTLTIALEAGATLNQGVTGLTLAAGANAVITYVGSDTFSASSGAGGSSSWGTISGAVENQVDLVEYVHYNSITESATSRTLGLTDTRGFISCTNGTGCTITVPPQVTVAFDDETQILGVGTLGDVTFIEGAGVNILIPDGRSLVALKGAPWALRRLSEDVWVLAGYLGAL